MLSKSDINQIPVQGGIYILKKGEKYFYVGKSVNIRARIKSHLENAKLDPKEAAMIKKSDKVDYLITDTEFKALLLEAKLIKEHRPKYNVIWKDGKSFLYVKITLGKEYPKVLLSRKENDGKSLYFGPFSSVKTTLQILREIRKIVPFCMEKNLTSKACFYSKIGLCTPCPSEIIREKNGIRRRTLRKIYRQNIFKVIRLLRGKIQLIINDFSRQLKKKIKEEKFEEAITLRDKILRLQYLEKRSFFDLNISADYNQSKSAIDSLLSLLSSHFRNLKRLERIECYDISTLSGQNATASLVVLTNGLIDKTQYRKFKVKNLNGKSDLAMLEEIFRRRFARRRGWPLPNLIVVDGGTPQVRLLKNVLKKLNVEIPLVGIAKNPDRLVLGQKSFPTLRPASNNLGFNLIRSLRDESHRFAHKYHLFLRKKGFLI